MIIYFTGTGNSKYVAEIMANQLNDTVFDASKAIKSGDASEFNSDKPYIFVSPVYAWNIPRVLKNWMQKCAFNGNCKAYFVFTCGSEIGAVGNYAEKLCSKLCLNYMGTAEVIMPENYLVMFDPPKEAEDSEIFAKAEEHVKNLTGQISEEKTFDKLKITLIGRLSSGIVNSCFYTFTVSARKFYATGSCTSCGKCAESCMLNNITLRDGMPVWGKNCTHCMACICKCPTEAIEYGKRTKGLRRYVCSKK